MIKIGVSRVSASDQYIALQNLRYEQYYWFSRTIYSKTRYRSGPSSGSQTGRIRTTMPIMCRETVSWLVVVNLVGEGYEK